VYTAEKPIKLNGKAYPVGAEVPETEINPGRVKSLLKYGILKFAPEMASAAPPTASGTNTRTETKEGAEAVKQPLNGTKKPAVRKQPVKKGGK